MQDLRDEALLASFRAGPEYLSEFYRRHVARVMGMGARRFRKPEDVADFVANVFLEVITSVDQFDEARGSAVAWLYGLGGNVASGMRRKAWRIGDAEERAAGRALLDSDDYVRVEERIDAATQARSVYEALQWLRDADRRLLELVAVDGLSPTEAASTLGISPIAARVRLVRARGRLRASLRAAHVPFPTHTVTEEARA